jgi:cytochrome d ubiquinol oxidase subunit I
MHTPTGHEIRNGIAYPVDWWAIVFNPSFPYRFVHMMTAAYLTTSVVVMAVGARYLLAGKYLDDAKTMLRMGLGMVAILAPLQLFIGDQHGLNTLQHQPTKIAAMEGHWEDDGPAALVLFGIPDQKAEKTHAEIAIPRVASVILTHSLNGRVPALKDVAPDERPPVANVFFAFRIMVGIGLLLILLGLAGAVLWWRKKVFDTRWFLRFAGVCWPLGFIAIVAGWVTTETGRQPYVAQGILRTADAISPVAASTVATSFVAFIITYFTVFSIGVYYIRKLIRLGPKGAAVEPPTPAHGLANRPLAHAQDSTREARSEGATP